MYNPVEVHRRFGGTYLPPYYQGRCESEASYQQQHHKQNRRLKMKTGPTVFWDATPSSLVVYRRFGGSSFLLVTCLALPSNPRR
jgi:hypothetical protein